MDFTGVFVEENHQVVVEVNEFQKLLNFQVLPERFDGWSHQNNVVIKVLVELLDANRVTGVATDQLKLQSVIPSSHRLDMLKEDRVRLQGRPRVN